LLTDETANRQSSSSGKSVALQRTTIQKQPSSAPDDKPRDIAAPIKQVFACYFAVDFCSAGHVENCTETLSPMGICCCFSGTESIT
jgi:hypothetical protein